MITLFLVVSISLFISFICSILEAVFLSVTHSYVVILSERKPRTGAMLSKMRKNFDQPIAAILTLNTIAHTVGASIGGAVALRVFGDQWIAAFSAFLTFIILVLSEILPKTIGAQYWKTLTPIATHMLHFMVLGMKPLLIPLSWINHLLSPSKKKEVTVSRAELAILAEIGRREGSIDDEEWQVVTNVIHLDEIRVYEVMTPRTDMVAVSIGQTLQQVKEVMLETGHFRLPVYEHSSDKIVGIILARDLLHAEQEGMTDIIGIIRDAYFVPDTKLVEDLLREMRNLKIKMAIVIDEFGGTAGLVTLEDLIEEIVGEIQDEHENEKPPFKETKNGAVRILGTVPIDEVNERLELNLPTDTYDTIGGYVFGELGRVPTEGDEVKCPKGKLQVLTMNGLRAERLLFIPKNNSKQ